MTNKTRHKVGHIKSITKPFSKLVAVTTIFVIFLSACTGLGTAIVRPNFSTELKSLRAGQYTLDPLHSFVNFRIGHLELSKIVGRFNTLEASLDFDPENPTALQLSGLIAANSIDLNNPDLEETLQEEDWFNAVQFPQITFDSSSVNLAADSTLEVEGTLSMRGIEQAVILLATFNGGADITTIAHH